jgi:hypothetical protein
MPSEKSWASTAAATTAPTAVETLKASPMPTPSRKLCTERLAAPSAPLRLGAASSSWSSGWSNNARFRNMKLKKPTATKSVTVAVA